MLLHRFVSANVILSVALSLTSSSCSQNRSHAESSSAYLGFDRNDYPGDAAMSILRKTFSYTGYWLGPPPGEKANSWTGKRALLQSQGFGFLPLYTGPLSSELKTEPQAKQRGLSDARNAAGSAQKEGFASGSIIFLDIEEGGRLSGPYRVYLREWADELKSAGYRPGVYCSGIPVSEGGGVTIITADDIRNNIGGRELAFWVFNDACPPSPGCASPKSPPPPSASGVSYAAVWQMSRSPRAKEFTAHCAATYSPDGNCYARGDVAHAWFLDVDVAQTPDPSRGSK